MAHAEPDCIVVCALAREERSTYANISTALARFSCGIVCENRPRSALLYGRVWPDHNMIISGEDGEGEYEVEGLGRVLLSLKSHALFPLINFISPGPLSDMLAITFPQIVQWGPAVAGWRWLVFVYLWDTVNLADNSTAFASTPLILCTQYFPCELHIQGYGMVELSGEAQIACLSSAGCSRISVHFVEFVCRSSNRSIFQIQGSTLSMFKVAFVGCSSGTDGGVVRAYDLAEVVIDECNFTDISSGGFGGAVAAYGSNLYVTNSLLHNCSSRSGGGAVWASAFQDCYGSDRTKSTYFRIASSIFSLCSTGLSSFDCAN